jgi:regulatory protein
VATTTEAQPGPRRPALDQALGLLARRDHSTLELKRKLGRAGHEPEAIDAALERLRELGYQNDGRYAQALERQLVGRGRGPRAVRAKLAQAGVQPPAPDESASDDPPRDWPALARQALERRFGTDPPSDRRQWQQRARFLLARGFTESQARSAVGRPPPDAG